MMTAGFVLTGGRSTRMGMDKALLSWRGEPLAVRLARAVAAAAGSASLVGAPERYKELGLPVLADQEPGCGPLAGIATALRSRQAAWNLIVACDMPWLTSEVLAQILVARSSTVDAVIPQHPGGSLEPLCAAYHQNALPHVEAALASGDFKVQNMIRQLRVFFWPVSEPSVFAGMNTPEQWRLAGGGI